MMYIKDKSYNNLNIKKINKKDKAFNNKCIKKEEWRWLEVMQDKMS